MSEISRHDVFISYSSKNKNVADAIVSDFEQNGIRCWYAPRDIRPGEEWVTAITKALEVSKALVLIYTDESNNSRQVMNEIAVAFNAGITIVPFKLSNEQMSRELEYYLTRVHWLDAVSKPLKENIASLRDYVAVIIKAGSGELTAGLPRGGAPAKASVPGKYKAYIPSLIAIALLLIFAIALKTFEKKRLEEATAEAIAEIEAREEAESDREEEDLTAEDEGTLLYEEGLTYYSEGNYALAYDRYIKASDAGSREAMKAAGDMLYDGIGVEINESKAVEFYLKAGGFTGIEAEPFFERDEDGLADEDMFNRLGLSYFYEYEYTKAAYFFILGAEEFDSVNCMGNAGITYESAMDWENAYKWYNAAIEAGHPDSERFEKKVKQMEDEGLV
ncbi:MAG: toll/interleukin-1 receptor domain-containing protein [Lachnospiraceae bacterium]|nr:toll/interleukin-1 receptor domain-containing protein [Lachnospiraceae bacterium]